MIRSLHVRWVPVLFLMAGLTACQSPEAARPVPPVPPKLDVPYVPTSQETVERMLSIAEVKPGDVLYDLGSGDGRIVITAVRQFGAERGVGVDLNPVRVAEAKVNAREAGVAGKTQFFVGDVFKTDFSEATVVTMYLLEHVNLKLRPNVLALRPGTRVVSHQFTMGDWEPDQWVREGFSDVMLWIVPAAVDGTWQWRHYRLDLSQKYQNVSGTMDDGRQRVALDRVVLRGDRLAFRATFGDRAVEFDGKVMGDAMVGKLDGEEVVLRRSR